MMVKPSVNELLDVIDDRYRLVIVASKRARQLAEGAPALTSKQDENPVTQAAKEIAERKVTIINDVEEE